MYLQELPGQARLAEARRADDADQAGAALAGRGVEQVLEQPQLLVAADERRLERVAAVAAADLGDDPQRAPGLDRRLLALEVLLAGLLEGDRLARGALGRLADEDGARLGDALEPAGGVDEVAGDHALVRRAERDGGLAGQDAGPGLDARAQGLDRVDELEAGPDGPLGVVLAGDGGAPDGHDGVADELLDGAAVAADHLAGELEVAVQELAGVLGVVALGDRGEADEVGEEDRRRGGARRRGRRPWLVRGALAGVPVPRASAVSGEAHSPQKRSPGSLAAPQFGQASAERRRRSGHRTCGPAGSRSRSSSRSRSEGSRMAGPRPDGHVRDHRSQVEQAGDQEQSARPDRDRSSDRSGKEKVGHGTSGGTKVLRHRREWTDPIVGQVDRDFRDDGGSRDGDRSVPPTKESGQDEPKDRRQLAREDQGVNRLQHRDGNRVSNFGHDSARADRTCQSRPSTRITTPRRR